MLLDGSVVFDLHEAVVVGSGGGWLEGGWLLEVGKGARHELLATR